MKIALFGGSFNPPHNGHIALALTALEELRPDKLIWMPCGEPPHKRPAKGTPSAVHRLAMSRLAVKGLDNTEVSDFEITGGARYTVDTVKMLLGRYKPEELWLLMGSDMWESYDTWHKADELKTLVKPFVVSREKVPVSSTEIRESPEKAGIPAAVWEYIRREGLYGHDNCVIMPSE